MLISIIIPSLNEEKYLPDLLTDLQNQTVKNFEVIVVDGLSDDKTKRKAMAFAKRLKLTFIESPKRNVAYQRNLGAKRAKGSFLFFLDADTRIENNVTAKIEHYIKKENKQLYLPYPKPDRRGLFPKMMFVVGIYFVVFLERLGRAFSFGPGIIIEKRLFEIIGGYDEKAYVAEDHGLVIKARKAGVTPIFLPDVKYVFSMRRGTAKIAWQYVVFSIISLFTGVIYQRFIKYEMGGHNFKKDTK